jgi:F-type H+-transporting ATPase subunit delta
MESTSIARNYADALLTLATKDGGRDSYGAYINGLADVLERDATFQRFLAAPQVSENKKNEVLGKALTGQAPALFVRFIQKMVSNRRQMLLAEVATEYNNLLDTQEGRVQARVTVSRELAEADLTLLIASLSKAMGKTVVPHVSVNPSILGGVIVRVGDMVMDGSVRRRLGVLRARMVR